MKHRREMTFTNGLWRKKTAWLMIIITLFLADFIIATWGFNYAVMDKPSDGWDAGDWPTNDYVGLNITTHNKTIIITNITIGTGSTDTTYRIGTTRGGMEVTNGSFSGTSALNLNITLNPNTKYWIMTYKDGSGRDVKDDTSSISYPYNFSGFMIYDDATINPGVWWNILQVGYKYADSYILQDFPEDNFTTANQTLSLGATALSNGAEIVNMSLWTNLSGVWAINQTTTQTGLQNSSIWSLTSSEQGKFVWSVEVCDAGNVCGFSENRTFNLDNIIIKIQYPTTSINALSFNVLANVTTLNNMSYCFFNITRGASLEVSNTAFPCNTTFTNMSSAIVLSSYSSYSLNIFANTTSGLQNVKYFPFTSSASVTGGGGGSAGGGGSVEPASVIGTAKNVCSVALPPLELAWKNYKTDKSSPNFWILWRSWWNYSLCKSGASIIPIE